MVLAAFTWSWFVEQIQKPLILFGFTAQFVFFMRFVVQWVVSERRGRSHIPISFWYLSVAGALMTFVYAAMREDVVFMTSQALALVIYVRNLMLIYRRQARLRARLRRGFPVAPADSAIGPTRAAPSRTRTIHVEEVGSECRVKG